MYKTQEVKKHIYIYRHDKKNTDCFKKIVKIITSRQLLKRVETHRLFQKKSENLDISI